MECFVYNWRILLGGAASAAILTVGVAAPAFAQAQDAPVSLSGLNSTSGVLCGLGTLPVSGEVAAAANVIGASCGTSSSSSSTTGSKQQQQRLQHRPRLGHRHAERRHRRPAERRLDHHAAVRRERRLSTTQHRSTPKDPVPGRGPSLILLGMDADRPAEPDVASLFAPVAVEETFDGVLTEARQVLGGLDDPVDAELWGSDLIGALASSATGQASLMNTLTGSLVPAAEAASTPEALALLRVFAAVGSPSLRAAAGQAAERIHAHDVADPPWAGAIGAPRVGDCWHYADVGGRQESLTMTFAYGEQEHAISVLIDHGRGGKIRDTWVVKGSGLRADTEQAAQGK